MESAGIDPKEYPASVKAGQLAAEKGIVYCGGEPLRQEDLEPIRDPGVMAHRDKVFEHHDDVLYPELEKLAYIPIRQISSGDD